MAIRGIKVHAQDNVAVVVADVPPGESVRLDDGNELTARESIPRGNKVALSDIAIGQPVFRYGEEIGLATGEIAAGDHVHTHNMGGRK